MTVLPHQSIADIDRQLPLGGEIFLDHVGHFVRAPAAAGRALQRLGFHATPVSIQVNPDPRVGEIPTGTINITLLLHAGPIESRPKSG